MRLGKGSDEPVEVCHLSMSVAATLDARLGLAIR